jgi:hypothetical protein
MMEDVVAVLTRLGVEVVAADLDLPFTYLRMLVSRKQELLAATAMPQSRETADR